MDYKVNISIEPYDGELRQVGNTFSFESAEIVAEILSKKREKLGLEVGKFFQQTQEPERNPVPCMDERHQFGMCDCYYSRGKKKPSKKECDCAKIIRESDPLNAISNWEDAEDIAYAVKKFLLERLKDGRD